MKYFNELRSNINQTLNRIESIDIFMILSIIFFTTLIIVNVIKYGVPN